MSTFAKWQPIYAEHNIPVFPVKFEDGDKIPAIHSYGRVGLQGSAKLARKFSDASMLGFMCGPRTKVLSLDVDTKDERILTDAIDRHGKSPVIVRTASGKFQIYYRHAGEPRRIRPWGDDLPIDQLGAGGYVVGVPSEIGEGRYEFIEGGLDDLDHLPIMRAPALAPAPAQGLGSVAGTVPHGRRNNELLRHCLRHADHCDDFDAMLDIARTFVTMRCEVSVTDPMTDKEVFETAKSAWEMQTDGRNWFVRPRVQTPHDIIDTLAAAYPEAMSLLLILERYHGGNETFALAKPMAKKLGWTLPLWRRARDRLVESGLIQCIHRGGRGKNDPPIYAWTKGVRFHAPI